jgi:hypothetical protein
MSRFSQTLGVLAFVAAVQATAQPSAEFPSIPMAVDPVTAGTPTLPSPPGTTVTSGDGLTVSLLNGSSRLKLFGQFSAIGVLSSTRPFPAGSPLFLLPRPDSGNNTNTFDLHARQTAIGAIFSGPEVFGLTPGANFLGFIQNDNLSSDAYGFLPFNAYGELKNEQWRFAAGLQSDVFNPANPTIISLLKLFASGNTGSFRGQARLEHFFKPTDGFQLTTQFALSEPVSTIISNNTRLLEDNGWPNVEGRVAAGFGAIGELPGGRQLRPIEFGVSGVVGQMRNSVLFLTPDVPEPLIRSTINVWGVGADLHAAITDRFGIAGEVFLGQGLGEYNGHVGQSFNSTTLRPIRGAGGFGEAYFYFTDALHLHAGYGIDAPIVRDLAATQIERNQSYFANLVWDASKAFQVSFQVDYRKTDYRALRNADGVVVLSQFLWRF